MKDHPDKAALVEELRKKDDEIERLASKLEAARGQIVARQWLAEMGELAAGVAVEIQTPLSFMNNFNQVSIELFAELAETLEEKRSALDPDTMEDLEELVHDIKGNMERVAEHSRRASVVVDRMIAFARSDGRFYPTDLNALVSVHASLAIQCVKAFDASLAVRVHESLDPGLGRVSVAPEDMARVVLNLVDNACHAMIERRRLEGGGPLALSRSEGEYVPTLTLHTRRREDGVEIRVRDNGTGMPDQARGRVFEPFFSTKPLEHGAGLGLSHAAEIVRRHRGSIRAESEPGSGTTMTISLPGL